MNSLNESCLISQSIRQIKQRTPRNLTRLRWPQKQDGKWFGGDIYPLVFHFSIARSNLKPHASAKICLRSHLGQWMRTAVQWMRTAVLRGLSSILGLRPQNGQGFGFFIMVPRSYLISTSVCTHSNSATSLSHSSPLLVTL